VKEVSKKVLAIVVAVVVIAVVAGVAYFLFTGGPKGVVKVTSVDLYTKPSEVTEALTPIEVRLGVENSFPATVRIEGGSLKVLIDDLKMAEISIPAQEVKQGSSVLVLNAVLDNALLDDFWYGHLNRREKSNVSIAGGIKVGTPVGAVELPVGFSSPVVTRIFPISQELNREYDAGLLGKVVVKRLVVELVGVTPSETKLRASITIENDLKAIPLYVRGVVFDIKTGGGVVLGRGEQERPKSIAPGEVDTIVFDVTMDNTKIPKLWVEHLRNRERTTIIVEVWLKVDIAGRSLELFKEHPLTVSAELRTSIFKYKE
jgi:LEA14-like dessication related protein